MSRQARWVIESPQQLDGMQNHYWKGDHPFFVPLQFDTGEPLWVEVPFEFVRGLVVHFCLDTRLDCGSCGVALYVKPVEPLERGGIEEKG